MQLSVTGHHVEITAALRSYVEKKCDRIVRHFDHVIDTHFVLTVEKLLHKAEATLRVRGRPSMRWRARVTCMPRSTPWPTSSSAGYASTRKS